MRAPRAAVLCALVLVVSVVALPGVRAQQPSAVEDSATDTGFGGIEEIIVRGRSFGDLRFEITRSEEAVFARFNEINSTDDLDIPVASRSTAIPEPDPPAELRA